MRLSRGALLGPAGDEVEDVLLAGDGDLLEPHDLHLLLPVLQDTQLPLLRQQVEHLGPHHLLQSHKRTRAREGTLEE